MPKIGSLLTALLLLMVQGFSQIILQESFDNKVFPSAGWMNRRTLPTVSTTINLWERVSVSNNPVMAKHSGDGMAFFNSYSYNAGTKTELATPAINFSAGGTFTLKFWMYRDGNPTANNDEIEVYVNTAQGAGGTLLATIARSYQLSPVVAAPGWYQYSFTIPPAYSGATNYIIFRAASATGNNMAIDDMEVSGPLPVLCNYPANLTITKLSTTSTSLAWNAPTAGTPDSYDWEIRTTGAPGSGSTGLINSGNVFTPAIDIAGLTANTNYETYVRSSCTATQSVWIGPLSFKTACSINNIPFTENFDGVAAPGLPNCFTVENRNSGNTWVNTFFSGSGAFMPSSTPNAVVFASQTSIAGDDWLYTPALNLTTGVNYRMQFLYKALFAGFSNNIEIKFGRAPVATAMNSGILYSNNAIANTSFQQASFTYTVPEAGAYYIGIHCITPTGAFNYQMMLDNFLIDIGPDPNCGIATSLVADMIGLNNTTISWASPATGTPVSYDWEIRTSGLPGSGASGLYSSGNIAAAKTINLTGLSMGTVYKFYLKTNCTNPSYGLWSGGISFTTLTTACGVATGLNYTNIVKDGFRANWVAPVISSTPSAYDWEVRTSGSGGSGASGLVLSGSTTNIFTDITGLSAATNYGFYVRVRCASGNNSTWVFSGGGVTTTSINDICSDALALSVGNGFCSSPLLADLAIGKPTANLSASCALLGNGSGTTNSLNDAWFKITIPPSGNAIVQTHTVLTSTVFNFTSYNYNNMLIAYTGTCGSLTEIACDLDGAPDDTWGFSTYQAKITFTGRTPGEVIYLRVMPDARNSPFVNFYSQRVGIGAWDTSARVRPAVSSGGNCLTNPSLNFSGSTNTDNYFRWNPIFDNIGNIVAEISANNTIGTTSTATFTSTNAAIRNSAGGKPLLGRNLSFTVQAQPSTYPTYIRIYYKKEELDKLKMVDPAVDYDLLSVIKTTGLCNGGIISGTETTIAPKAYGKYGNDYYIEIETSSLGNFFIGGSSAISKICSGGNTSFVSNIGGSTFQWQVNTGAGFVNITSNSNYAGTTTNTLQIINTPLGWYGYQYRCLVNAASYSNSFKIQFVNTWTGASDTKWENAGNWSCGFIPDGNMDVIINSGNIFVESATATCRSLYLKPGAQLTVTSGNNLKVIH